MDDFYSNIFKIIESVGMCDTHRNELTAKLNAFFKNNKFDPQTMKYTANDSCCSTNESSNDSGCCKNSSNTNNSSGCCKN